MAPSRRETRDAVAETRSDVTDAIADLAEKLDVRKVGESAHKASASAKDQLGERASQAKATASALRAQAAEKVPAQVAAVEDAVGSAREAAVSTARSPKGRTVLVGVLLAIVAAIAVRRLSGGR